MAYHPYGDVPTFDIPDNVQVQVATHGPWGILNEADMTKQLDKIRGWTKKLGRKVWLWNYAIKWSTLTLPNVPHGTPKAWAKFYASLAPYIGGAFVESSSDRSVYNFLCYYIFGKVSWNPACDWQRMLDGIQAHRAFLARDLPQSRKGVAAVYGPDRPEGRRRMAGGWSVPPRTRIHAMRSALCNMWTRGSGD